MINAEARDVTLEIHTLLGKYMKDREADACIVKLNWVMQDYNDGPELVRLMQEWGACV